MIELKGAEKELSSGTDSRSAGQTTRQTKSTFVRQRQTRHPQQKNQSAIYIQV